MRSITLDELCNRLKDCTGKRVTLTFHSIGDRDSVGSAVALAEYFNGAALVTPDFITNNAKKLLEYVNYNERIANALPKESQIILVLDANNFAAVGRLGKELREFKGELLFIDHHAPHAKPGLDALIFNDESYNSTSSIVYEVLCRLGAKITKRMAILLLNGIIADSADLNNSSPKTFRQIADLLEIADVSYSSIAEYFHAVVPVNNRYETMKDIYGSRAEVIGDYILISGWARAHSNIAADAAISLGADAAVFWADTGKEASLSARLRSPLDKTLNIHLGMIMQNIGKTVGGTGGGHACAAGAYGSKREAAQEAGEEVLVMVREKLQNPKGVS